MAEGRATATFGCSADEYLAFVLDVERYRDVDDKLFAVEQADDGIRVIRSVTITLAALLRPVERLTVGRHLQASVERELALTASVLRT